METIAGKEAPALGGTGELVALMYSDGNEFGLVRFLLRPGEEIASHVMPFEVCFLVLQGRADLRMEDEVVTLNTGSIAVCHPGASRSWSNPGMDSLEVLVLKLKNSKTIGDGKLITRILSEQPLAKNPHGVEVRRVYESEHALSSVVTLKPGEKLLRHITPVDVFFYVLEGSGFVEVGDERILVEKDTLIESPRDIPHCWYNESSETLRFLVVKVPKPTGKTILL